MGEIEKSVVLLVNAVGTLKHFHMASYFREFCQFRILEPEFLDDCIPLFRRFTFQFFGYFEGIVNRFFSHIVYKAIVVDHHMELVDAHDTVISIFAGMGILLDAACVEARYLNEHLDAVAIEKILVAGEGGILFDSESN